VSFLGWELCQRKLRTLQYSPGQMRTWVAELQPFSIDERHETTDRDSNEQIN